MSYQISWIEENKDMICGNEYQWHVVETLEEVSRYKAWLRKNGTYGKNIIKKFTVSLIVEHEDASA